MYGESLTDNSSSMPYVVGRRQFLRGLFPGANVNSEGPSRLEEVIEGEDTQILNTHIDRREALGRIGTGLATFATTSKILSGQAEAQGRPRGLAGSSASLAKQIRMFKQDDLSMLYDKDLQSNSFYRKDKRLVVVDRSTSHYYVEDVEFGNAITRPYVSLFLQRLSQQYYNQFKDRLKVTSLSRSYEDQVRLRRRNGNATLPERSPHVRGAGIDISYASMNSRQKQWMRNILVDLERANLLEATEERRQPTFHVMVFKNYHRYVQRRLGMNNRNFAIYYERMTGGRIY